MLLRVILILALHDFLRKNNLGGSLLYSSLAFSLELAHDRVASASWNYHVRTKNITTWTCEQGLNYRKVDKKLQSQKIRKTGSLEERLESGLSIVVCKADDASENYVFYYSCME
jgi:hypothetical protein